MNRFHFCDLRGVYLHGRQGFTNQGSGGGEGEVLRHVQGAALAAQGLEAAELAGEERRNRGQAIRPGPMGPESLA